MRKVRLTAVDEAVRALWNALPELGGDANLFVEAIHGFLGEPARTDYGVCDVENPLVPTNPRRSAFVAGRRLRGKT